MNVRAAALDRHDEALLSQQRNCLTGRAARDAELLLQLRLAGHWPVGQQLPGPDARAQDVSDLEVPAVQPDPLPPLCAEFPGFRIWREITGDRTRYVARSLHHGISPHTVVTDDLAELTDVLREA